MSKKELIKELAEQAGLSQVAAGDALEALTTIVTTRLQCGEDVTLPGIGKLHAKLRPARQGRNPKTNESMEFKASTAVKFSVSTVLKAAVN